MKKKFRIAIIVDISKSEHLYKLLSLAFGRENVRCSLRPEDLFGILREFKPSALIISPDLFEECGIPPQDINAYKKRLKYRVIAFYATEHSLRSRERVQALDPDKEYILPTEMEYLTIADEIPRICTNNYTKRKEPLQKRTMEEIDRIFTQCGFHCDVKGAPFLKEALCKMYFNPDLHRQGGAIQIYRELAQKYDTTPRIVERSILRCLESSWSAQTEEALRSELKIPDYHQFMPLNFGRFTEIFNTYYTIKNGDPQQILSPKKKKRN